MSQTPAEPSSTSPLLSLAIVVGTAALAYFAYTMMVNMIPAGPPPAAHAATPESYNDPTDLNPREPQLPPGPHLDAFVFNCTACHSTRLTMTQPTFPRAKWDEIVHKMVATYGAKIPPELEDQIAQYLAAVKGPKVSAPTPRAAP
jgi:hypothetical protein